MESRQRDDFAQGRVWTAEALGEQTMSVSVPMSGPAMSFVPGMSICMAAGT
jgi:hypothetical protein